MAGASWAVTGSVLEPICPVHHLSPQFASPGQYAATATARGDGTRSSLGASSALALLLLAIEGNQKGVETSTDSSLVATGLVVQEQTSQSGEY